MRLIKYWFRTRVGEAGYDKTNLSLEPKTGYKTICLCERCNKRFFRLCKSCSKSNFELCDSCATVDRNKLNYDAIVRSSREAATLYQSKPENRLLGSRIAKERYYDKEYVAKHRRSCKKRSADPEYREKLKKNATRGLEHAIKTACGLQGISIEQFSGFVSPESVRLRALVMPPIRLECFKLANFKCDICCCTGKLNAHHKNSWNWAIEQRSELNNLVCLCNNCHKLFHSIYGNRDNTEEQYIEFRAAILS